MKKIFSTLVTGAMFCALAASSQASSVTFAQFLEGNSDGNAFVYSDLTSTLSNQTGGVDTTFTFLNSLGGLSGGFVLNHGYDANLTITTHLIEPSLDALTNDIHDLTFKFVAGASTPDPGAILLQGSAGFATPGGTGTGGTLFAQQPLSSAVMNGSNNPGQTFTSPEFVFFKSDVLNMSNITEQNYALSFSSILDTVLGSAGIHYTPTGPFTSELDSFTSAGTGTFAATTTPEPGSVALAVGALVSFGGLRFRRRRK